MQYLVRSRQHPTRMLSDRRASSPPRHQATLQPEILQQLPLFEARGYPLHLAFEAPHNLAPTSMALSLPSLPQLAAWPPEVS